MAPLNYAHGNTVAFATLLLTKIFFYRYIGKKRAQETCCTQKGNAGKQLNVWVISVRMYLCTHLFTSLCCQKLVSFLLYLSFFYDNFNLNNNFNLTDMAEVNLDMEILYKCSGLEFFCNLEKYLNTSISNVLKNILRVNGMDSALILSEYNNDASKEIETFMRNNFQSAMLGDFDKMFDYLGVFEKCQKEFVLLPGHKILMNIISKECKNLFHCGSGVGGNENIGANENFEVIEKQNHRKLLVCSDVVEEDILLKKTGSHMITVFNDAKKITLSAWSWPSRIVADKMAAFFELNGFCMPQTQLIDLNYCNPTHHADLLNSIVESDFENLKSKIQNALAISLRLDGSVDRTQKHNVYVMANIVDKDTSNYNIFIGFDIPEDGTAAALHQILKVIVAKIMPWEEFFKLVSSIVADGEPINQAKYKGLCARLKNERWRSGIALPFFSIWCIAHRINLAWKSISDKNMLVANLIQDANSLSSFFHLSAERTQSLKEIAADMNFGNILRFPSYFSIRWTEFTYDMFYAVMRNWRATVEFFKSHNEIGLLNRWLNFDRIYLLAFIIDLLTLLKAFQKTFESDDITILDVATKKNKFVKRLEDLRTKRLHGGWEEEFFLKINKSNGQTLLYGHILIPRSKNSNCKFGLPERDSIIFSLITSIGERLGIDEVTDRHLMPLSVLSHATTHRALNLCHSFIVPDLNEADFVAEYRHALEFYKNAVFGTPYEILHALKIDSRTDRYPALTTALARAAAAKPHSSDVERLISRHTDSKYIIQFLLNII